jgi:hypothetical protein
MIINRILNVIILDIHRQFLIYGKCRPAAAQGIQALIFS